MASRKAKEKMKAKKGGKIQDYNAQGSHEEKEALETAPEFKKGGVAKKKKDHEKLKHGGHAEGEEMKMRADRKPMAHKRKAGGRTPYSSGHETSMPKEGRRTDLGHEGERPAGG
jgi:hypothetical protein